MATEKVSIEQKLAEIRADYINKLPERIRALVKDWRDFLLDTSQTSPLQLLFQKTHSLKGSGTTFGFSNITTIAGSIHDCLTRVTLNDAPLTNDDMALIDSAVAKLSGLADELQLLGSPNADYEVFSEAKKPVDPGSGPILLVEDDPHLAQNLAVQVSAFGYEVRVLDDTQRLLDELAQITPLAIIMDVMFSGNEDGGFHAIERVKRAGVALPPIVFLSSRYDIEARLRALRLGAGAYLTKPIAAAELVDKLDSLLDCKKQEPYRVLIVDDSRSLAEYYAIALQAAGIQVQVVTNPLEVLNVLSAFNPELILMDMYMPECSGLELAAVIRQQESYVGIPIVFLSAERNTDKQLQAMSLGGDDFLTKPIEVQHLISSVRSRVERSRKLRSYMVRDSLTGLFNHTKTKEFLEQEISRAKRQSSQLVFAMIDIDKFKQVNDQYGHPTGDGVIKSLARLLRQRLRKSDIIGRYGGEEFAVILVDTSLSAAEKVLNDVRESFSQISQAGEKTVFHSSFSCGLASYPSFASADALNEAADQALYRAKQAGRNCVKCSV